GYGIVYIGPVVYFYSCNVWCLRYSYHKVYRGSAAKCIGNLKGISAGFINRNGRAKYNAVPFIFLVSLWCINGNFVSLAQRVAAVHVKLRFFPYNNFKRSGSMAYCIK